MPGWGAAIAAGLELASGAIERSARKKNAAELDKSLDVRRQASNLGFSMEAIYGTPLEAPGFNFSEDDIYRITDKLAGYNAGRGTDLANKSAGKVNQQTLDDLERGMRQLFGGDAYDTQREKTNQIVDDQLSGKLSQSTRQLLARRSLSSGASGVGEGAVDDLYAGYLGLTTEGIVQQGMDNYRSLYSMYRQSYPLVTGLDTMQYTTTRPEAGVEIALRAAEAQYVAELNAAFAESQPDPVASGLIQSQLSRGAAVASARGGANIALAQSIGNAAPYVGYAVNSYNNRSGGTNNVTGGV